MLVEQGDDGLFLLGRQSIDLRPRHIWTSPDEQTHAIGARSFSINPTTLSTWNFQILDGKDDSLPIIPPPCGNGRSNQGCRNASRTWRCHRPGPRLSGT